MESTQLDDGRWKHRCLKCGVVRFAKTSKYSRQCPKFYKGLGSRLEWVLKKAGITPERWSQFIKKPCKCTERKELLDRIAPWI